MRRLLLGVAALVVVGGVVWWFALRDHGDGDRGDDRSKVASEGSAAATGGSAPGASFSGGAQPSLPSAGTPGAGSGATAPDDPEAARAAELARANAALAKSSPVPINSRPLLESESMFLAPNARQDPLTPGAPAKKADGTPGDRGAKPELYYLFTGDRYGVVGGETLTTTLQAWSDEAKTQVAPIKIVSAKAGKVALKYAPTPTGGFSNTWSPASSGLPAGNHTIDVAFLGPSGAEYHAQLLLAFTPKADVPARFSGKLTDRLDKGSLVVSAGVEVIDAGEFIVDANLFDSAGKPIARANFRGSLAKGGQSIDLVFYGKIIRDHGVPGPFVVRDLRGYRTRPGEQPNRADMAAHADDYTTKAYALDVFTSEPWPTPGRPIVPSGS